MGRPGRCGGEGGLADSVGGGEDCSAYAPCHCCTGDAAEDGVETEGRVHDELDRVRHVLDVHHDDRDRQGQISDGENRYESLGDFDDPSGATQDDHGDQPVTSTAGTQVGTPKANCALEEMVLTWNPGNRKP